MVVGAEKCSNRDRGLAITEKPKFNNRRLTAAMFMMMIMIIMLMINNCEHHFIRFTINRIGMSALV